MKNLHKLDRIPDDLRESIFEKLFETAEIAKFSKEEYQAYEDSLKYYRDLKNSLDTAKQEGRIEGKIEGRAEGIVEGKIETATKMLEKGLYLVFIAEITGLTEEEINKIANT